MYYQCQNCDTVFDDYEAERQPEYVGGVDGNPYTTILVCPRCGGKDLYENPPDPCETEMLDSIDGEVGAETGRE